MDGFERVATRDETWLAAGRDVLASLRVLRHECGVPCVKGVLPGAAHGPTRCVACVGVRLTSLVRGTCCPVACADVTTRTLLDWTPSFYLSELLKYLYLYVVPTRFAHPSLLPPSRLTVALYRPWLPGCSTRPLTPVTLPIRPCECLTCSPRRRTSCQSEDTGWARNCRLAALARALCCRHPWPAVTHPHQAARTHRVASQGASHTTPQPSAAAPLRREPGVMVVGTAGRRGWGGSCWGSWVDACCLGAPPTSRGGEPMLWTSPPLTTAVPRCVCA